MGSVLHYRSVACPPLARPLAPLVALAGVAKSSAEDVVLLHSSGRGLSVLGIRPRVRILVDVEGRLMWSGAGFTGAGETAGARSPLEALQEAMGRVAFVSPEALVGWLGFVGYDIGGTLERVPRVAPEELRWPLAVFTLFEHYVVFDSGAGAVRGYSLEGAGELPWDVLIGRSGATEGTAGGAVLVERLEPEAYRAKIRRVQEYIAAGDIYQANLAQRWVAGISQEPVDIFARLVEASPAPYAAFLRFTDEEKVSRSVLSASPELFMTVNGGHVVTRPIKGTRPRDLTDAARDRRLRDELLNSMKDRAELAMIVDLLRNDLGRVSRFGSVQVSDPRALEGHPTVWHTAATIEADLLEGTTLAELLAAVCPGGSITGAPKIRAMQIIEELEGFRRGLYCGNIGVVGPVDGRGVMGTLALNIAIRTILVQGGRAYLYAGGGIVADSVAELEYEETLHKAAAQFRAIGLTLPG